MNRYKRYVFLLIFVFSCFLLSSIAYAKNAAYILPNINNADQKIIQNLAALNFTVDKVSNANIAGINWSRYEFMVIGDGVFSNKNLIPVNNFPALIINTRHMDYWHWTRFISQKASNQPLSAYVNDPSHIITKNFQPNIKIYSSSTPSVYYLHRHYKASQLKSVIATDNSTSLNKLNAIIATAEPGAKLKDGFKSNTKSVFFGITNAPYWTPSTEQSFRNSVVWLVTDFIGPSISNLSVNLTNHSALIRWSTNKGSNSTIYFGQGQALDSSKSNKGYLTQHNYIFEGLNEKTAYSYRISLCNRDDYCNQTGTLSFTTLDSTAPYLLSSSAINITNSSATISAITNENSISKVFYGKNQDFDMVSHESELTLQAALEVSGLNEKTGYAYFVNSCDSSNNCRNSSVFSFDTIDLTEPDEPKNLFLEPINPNGIKIMWDSAVDDAVKHNIYFSRNPGNFNFSAPDAVSFSGEYVDTGAPNARERYYVVRAEDSYGNEEKNQNVAGKYDLGLKKGYNLVSLPLVPFSNNIDEIMHQSISYSPISEIKKFDNINQEFKPTSFALAFWNPLSFKQLNYGEGYFFKAKQEVDFTIVGTLPKHAVLDLKEGMNLFGITSLESKNITGVIIQEPDKFNVTEVGKRNDDGTYRLATYYPTGWDNNFGLETGNGYWLKANKDFKLKMEP